MVIIEHMFLFVKGILSHVGGGDKGKTPFSLP